MNIFALLSLAVLPFYIFLGWYVFVLKPKSRINRIFILLPACFAIWAFTFIFFYSAPDKQTAWFWYNLSSLGRFFYPAVLLSITLFFTKNRFITKKWYYSLPLYIPAFIFLYAIFTGPFITQDLLFINSEWYESLITDNIWWYAYTSYYLAYFILAFLIIGRWGYKSTILRERKQALIILSTGALAFALGTITNTVLQMLNIYILPSMAQIFGVIFFSGIAYTIVKYKLLKLTAAVAAEQIISKITDLVILMDPAGRIIKINTRTRDLLGYSKSDLEDKKWEFIMCDSNKLTEIEKHFNNITDEQGKDETLKDLAVNFKTKDGEEIPVNSFLSTLKDEYGPIGVLLVGQDMRQTRKLQHEIEEKVKAQSKAKEHEKEIKKSLKEKEILLKEIHHRVKNNMQIVSSLLNLQAGYIKDKKAVNALKECQGRIMSMAMIHENLYRSDILTGIKFKDYLNFLIKNIFHTHNISLESFNVNIYADDIVLDIDTAIPCGLIINELVTNSLIHAFPEIDKGELTIQMEQEHDEYYLKVADNGIGIPSKLDINNTTTLGLLLVNSLVGQLEGKLEVSRNQGTTFLISFKKLEYPDRM